MLEDFNVKLERERIYSNRKLEMRVCIRTVMILVLE